MATDAVSEFDRALGLLTVRQYLYPHESLAKALVAAFGQDFAAGRAIEAELLEPQAAIGRLARKDLLRLARRIAVTQLQPAQDSASVLPLVA